MLKNFRRMRVVYGIVLTSDIFHTCVSARIMQELSRLSCVRGYHIYQNVWDAAIGEILTCEWEPSNLQDRYTVAFKKEGISIVGHTPKNVSLVCSLFLRRRRTIECTITGTRRYSADLVQGCLEVPCFSLFKGKEKEVQKLKKVWKK